MDTPGGLVGLWRVHSRPARQTIGAAVVGMLLLGIVGCGGVAESGQTETSQAVQRFLAAREARDLPAAMACFVDQPVVRSNLGVTWSGREAVQAVMAYRLTDDYTISNVQANANRVTWTEHVHRAAAGTAASNFDEDVEAVVVEGRIASLVTYVGGTHPAVIAAVPAPQGTDPFLPLSVLLLVAGAVLVWPPASPARPAGPANNHLMDGLREYVARRG